MMETFWQDVRYALRLLGKSPGFTALAVFTLALGIGANSAIFSVLDPLLLRKLPVQNPDELVWVNSSGTMGPAEISEIETFYAYRDKAAVFSGVLAFAGIAPYAVTHNGRTALANGELVSGSYFTTLGVRPFAGRLFTDIDEHQDPAVVLSFDFWRREFNSDPAAIGKSISFGDQVDASRTGTLPERSFTIVGIAPPEFFGAEVGKSPDFYFPLGATNVPSQDYWQRPWVTILARLKPGVSIAQAQASLDPLLHDVENISTLPEIERQENFAHVLLPPAARGLSQVRSQFSLPAVILMVVVGLLLLIACANVANLLLARGIARKREFTVRLALGAGRLRIIRQLLTESALLAAAGALSGLIVGQWTSHLLAASFSTPLVGAPFSHLRASSCSFSYARRSCGRTQSSRGGLASVIHAIAAGTHPDCDASRFSNDSFSRSRLAVTQSLQP